MAKKRGNRKVHRGRRRKKGFVTWSLGKKIAVIALSAILTVVIGGGVAAAAYLTSKMDKLETTEELHADALEINKEVEHKEGYVNVALFGVDSRDASLGKGTRSDTIIVASLNQATGEIRMCSVYRDTLLQQSDGSYNKANAAYSFGGVEGAVALLNKNLDLDIEHYVTVNFNAMIAVVDILGGIEVDLTEEEVKWTNSYCNETAVVTGYPFPEDLTEPGLQTLNGIQATSYCRIRYTKGDDFKRTERQRLVIQKIAEKLQSANLATLNKIIDEVFKEVGTNFTLPEILSYAKDFKQYRLGETAGFPFDKTTDTLSGIGSTVIPVNFADNVSQLHQFLFGDDGYTPSSTVNTIASGIKNKAGDVKAASDEELSNYKSDDNTNAGNATTNTGNNNNNTNNTSPSTPSGGGNTGGGNTGGGETGGGTGGGETGGETGGGETGGGETGGGETGGGETGGSDAAE